MTNSFIIVVVEIGTQCLVVTLNVERLLLLVVHVNDTELVKHKSK